MKQKYIALLRGINVGGKNKVSMPILKEAFEEAGFSEVITYINSGNVVFSSDITDITELINIAQQAIAKRFELNIQVGVITFLELELALQNAPEWWDAPSDLPMVHQAIFVIPPMTAKEVLSVVGEPKAEYEKVGVYSNVIFWSALKENFSKTRWCKISSTSIYHKVTIRNANTSKKLAALCR